MMLSNLRTLGVHKALETAATVIEARGLAKQMHQDPETFEVDIEGAVMLACGAEELYILVGRVDELVPAANLALYDATINLLDDNAPTRMISEWNDREETTQEEALQLLRSLAFEVQAALSA